RRNISSPAIARRSSRRYSRCRRSARRSLCSCRRQARTGSIPASMREGPTTAALFRLASRVAAGPKVRLWFERDDEAPGLFLATLLQWVVLDVSDGATDLFIIVKKNGPFLPRPRTWQPSVAIRFIREWMQSFPQQLGGRRAFQKG